MHLHRWVVTLLHVESLLFLYIESSNISWVFISLLRICTLNIYNLILYYSNPLSISDSQIDLTVETYDILLVDYILFQIIRYHIACYQRTYLTYQNIIQ